MNRHAAKEKLRVTGELGLIRNLKQLFPKPVGLGASIGEDTACLPYDGRYYLLFTVDALVEGVDFRRPDVQPEAIGRKALAVNLSDIAAMGGLPSYAVVSLGMPAGLDLDFFHRFYAGFSRLARKWNVSLVGGDLSQSKILFASVTLLGKVERSNALFRSGARTGDSIFVTGSLGGSILGKHLTFVPRIKEARFLARNFKIHSMIDVSDGLMQDLGHILEESRKGARLFVNRLPVSKAARRAARLRRRSLLQSALCDGEDFELLFTCSDREGEKIQKLRGGVCGTPVTRIGEITQKGGLLFYATEDHARGFSLPWKGYQHF